MTHTPEKTEESTELAQGVAPTMSNTHVTNDGVAEVATDTVEGESMSDDASSIANATPPEVVTLEIKADDAETASAESLETDVPDGTALDAPTADASTADEPPIEADLLLLEALLFATRHPLTAGKLAELLDIETTAPVRRATKMLNDRYVATGRAFRVEQVAGGFQLLTLPEYGETLKKLHQKEADAKLTKAALETLAVIAYKQPILRADIEAIRGVACGETVRSLMEKHLVRIAGRAEMPGRPILYGTTRRFLEIFGLANLKDLPKAEDQPLRNKEN